MPPGARPTTLVPCPPGTFDLTAQAISPPSPGVTGTLRILAEGPNEELASGETKLSATVPDGTTYSASVQPLGPSCSAVGPSRPVSATFGLTYRAVVENDPSDAFTCVFRSRADYSSFTLMVTGTALDSVIQAALDAKIKADTLWAIDFQVADRMNRFKRNEPVPGGTDPRCNWKELDSDGVVRR